MRTSAAPVRGTAAPPPPPKPHSPHGTRDDGEDDGHQDIVRSAAASSRSDATNDDDSDGKRRHGRGRSRRRRHASDNNSEGESGSSDEEDEEEGHIEDRDEVTGELYDFAITVDAGSHGCRAHIFAWPRRVSYNSVPPFSRVATRPNWMKQTKPGISAFQYYPEQAISVIKPLVDWAKRRLAKHRHRWATIPFFLKATAGVSLVLEAEPSRAETKRASCVHWRGRRRAWAFCFCSSS